MAITCYAQRLLNPFRGVMNIIEYEGAEAVTTDGIHWDIYVRDTELVKDISNSSRVQTSDIRYGSWSETEGLKRGAIYPSDDFKLLEHRGAIVYEYLLQHYRDVPFRLRDHYELWLLDQNSHPLALLDSAIRESDLATDGFIDWRAGIACQKTFTSATPWQQQDTGFEAGNAGEHLTRYINERAGSTPGAQWFQRDDQGGGTGLTGIQLANDLMGRQLAAERFPVFYLSEQGHDTTHAQLVQDFIEWQSPWLLLLHGLSEERRSHFEQAARRQALAVERQYHLYPRIIDADAIAAARVEATLRKHQPEHNDEAEAMSTYYIELNVTRTN